MDSLLLGGYAKGIAPSCALGKPPRPKPQPLPMFLPLRALHIRDQPNR
jgi:hypothetical protein